MADNIEKPESGSMAGSIAANFHEGSRSEYLAQFVFSSFGTSIPVPHQEDSGLDLYCTLLERQGRRAWPRAYYSVQVKSTMDPWVFGSSESVRWIIEHPLPIFLCIVEKAEARIFVYHTTPRFAVWALPMHPVRLELRPGNETKAITVGWVTGDTFDLKAPILNFTIQELLDGDFRARATDVLKFWIEYDMENLFRIKSGIHHFRVPNNYETNTTKFTAWSGQGADFQEKSLQLALDRLKELMGHIATHYYRTNDMLNAAIYAMTLRQLSPEGWSGPWPFDPHDALLHGELNRQFKMEPPTYLYQAADSLLKMVKDELLRHGIAGGNGSGGVEMVRPEEDFLRWLVPARSRIQDALLRLYDLALYYEAHPNEAASKNCSIYRLLLGAGFSLWRSVFQAHTDLSVGENVKRAKELLETVMRDNAVLYPTEKNSWSFGYYLNNAKYRLVDIHGWLEEPFKSDVEPKVQKIRRDAPQPTTAVQSRATWDAIFDVFDSIVEHLRKDLRVGRDGGR